MKTGEIVRALNADKKAGVKKTIKIPKDESKIGSPKRYCCLVS